MSLRAILTCGLLLAAPVFAAKENLSSKETAIPEGPKIRVLLAKDVNSALLEVKGGYRVVRKDSGSPLSLGLSGKRFIIHALQDGLRWGEEYPDVYQISIVPTGSNSHVYVDGIQYCGRVSIYHVQDNRITVVNEIPIEDYLKSTLALKFTKTLSSEAMEALAIAARTEAYSRALNGRTTTRPWDVNAKDSDYFGHGITRQQNSLEEAIVKTRFMIVESAKDGKPVQNIRLNAAQADELAHQGLDAQEILRNMYPQAKIGVTISADEVALRIK